MLEQNSNSNSNSPTAKTIFKSHQVNLDPEPWRNRYDGSRWGTPGVDAGRYRKGEGVLDFDPRPEFEPTRDPQPWLAANGERDSREDPFAPGGSRPKFRPRRGQFDTPVNRVLAYAREFLAGRLGEDLRQEVLSLLDALEDAVGYSTEEIDHARKVLTRLVNFNTKEN